MSDLPDGIARLSHLGVIRVQGEDAARFLHGQLTQDFSLLGLSEARLAAFCSAKGRMQASFIGFRRSEGDILLVCSSDLLAPTLKRLSMFVLRAKAKLTDATAEFAVLGLSGAQVSAVAGSDLPPWTRRECHGASVVGLYPADGQVRALWVAPAEVAVPAGPALASDAWLLADVRSGVATVTASVVDAFVPQMLNYESVGGVNFKKGCYPGQEVVARSQFRGTLKRRAFLASCSATLSAGQEIYLAAAPDEPCGQVVQAAPASGAWEAIVCLHLTAADAGGLRVGSAGGAELRIRPVPYPLLADI